MEGFMLITVLSLAMFLGCWLAGLVPLSVNFSESKLRLVTVFGAGLLVGTALAVIIPEGVSAIYQAQAELQQDGPSNFHRMDSVPIFNEHQSAEGILDKSGVVAKQVGQVPDGHQAPPVIHHPKEKPIPLQNKQKEQEAPHEQQKRAAVPTPAVQQTNSDQERPRPKRDISSSPTHHHEQNTHQHQHEESKHSHNHSHEGMVNTDVHSMIGMALVFGFVFMLIVDQIGANRGGASSVSNRVDSSELTVVQPRYKITATIGLVVHAAADGIALGAASTTKHTDIQFIVFVAIMLHKAPAAFGLVTFLQHEGLDKSRIKKHLLTFALAAPIAAMFTYVGISQGGSEALSSLSSTGLLMLFSAGTFLYVATVHVLPEIVHSGQSEGSGGVGGGHSHGSGGAFKLNELVAIVAGALLPSVLTLGHSHGH